MKRVLATFATGFLFAIGLGLAGMTQPEKVLGFLDVTGRWDPSLAFVMGGAVLFGLVAFPLVLARARPVFDTGFHLPTRKQIDAPLVIGSVLFGLGWGASGYCPGPALVSVVTGASQPLVFVLAMLVGMALFEVLPRGVTRLEDSRPPAPASR